MSSKEHRSLKSGDERWVIRFRHEGKNCNVPFFTEGAADSFRAMVDTLGPARALQLASTPPTVAPTVRRTVSQQVEHHINHLTGVTDGTRAKYRKIQHARLDPWFRDVLLSDLTRDHVAAWVNAQTGAPKTVFNAQALLSSAVGSAVRDGLVGTNVVKGVRPPRAAADTEEPVYLTHEGFAPLSSSWPACSSSWPEWRWPGPPAELPNKRPPRRSPDDPPHDIRHRRRHHGQRPAPHRLRHPGRPRGSAPGAR